MARQEIFDALRLLREHPLLEGVLWDGFRPETLLLAENDVSPGEDLLVPDREESGICLIVSGSGRLLGGHQDGPVSLGLVGVGELLGLETLCGGQGEWVRASTSMRVIRLKKNGLLALLENMPGGMDRICERVGIAELYHLVAGELAHRRAPSSLAPLLARELLPQASLIAPGIDEASLLVLCSGNARRIAIPKGLLEKLLERHAPGSGEIPADGGSISSSLSTKDEQASPADNNRGKRSSASSGQEAEPSAVFGARNPPFHKASSPGEAVFACLRMLAGQLGLPFREEVVSSSLKFHMEGVDGNFQISLPRIGSVADMIGIATQPVRLSPRELSDQETPYLLASGVHPLVVQSITPHSVLLADPLGVQEWIPLDGLPEPPDERGHVVLLTRRSRPPKGEVFGFRSLIPYIRKHARTFVEVIVASLLIQVFALANPLIIQIIIDKVIVQESLDTLDILAWLLAITVIFSAALTAIRTFLFTDATNRIDIALGLRVLEHLYRLPLTYFHQRPVGEIAARLRELETIRSFLTGTAITALIDAFFSLIFIWVMLLYSVELTAVALVGVPLLVILTLGVSPIIRRQLKDRAEKNAATESHLVESLTGIQTIKGQNIETRSRWKWYGLYGEMILSSFRNTITGTGASTAGMLVNRFNDVAVLWVGVYLVISQKITLGQLIAFRIFAGYVTGPILRLAQSWQGFQQAALSVNRLGDVVNRAREDQDSEGQLPMEEINGSISCRDLDFGYAPGRLQLRNVSLDIPAGGLVAVVGLSGSGKSTLLKIIARLYEPVAGRVEIDGYNLSKVELNSLRCQIGMVFQETLLMDGTVMENISMSNPDAPSGEIVKAARLAEAHDFIMTLPNGYATPVGEQGRNLSGGQRQRIALARLILHSPRLLLLDEATSALDAPTEQRVISNLRGRFSGRTILFATHRLSTVRMADRIFYLRDGQLMEQGSHRELIERQGLYHALVLQQEENS